MENINFIQVGKKILSKLAPYWYPEVQPEKISDEDKDKAWNVCNGLRADVVRWTELGNLSLFREVKVCPYPPIRAESNIASRGDLVKVKPSDPKYDNKCFLGFFLGEIALGSTVKVDNTTITSEFVRFTPFFYVPDIGEWFYGISGWWALIKNENDFDEILASNPESTWYVELAQAMLRKKSEALIAEEKAKFEASQQVAPEPESLQKPEPDNVTQKEPESEQTINLKNETDEQENHSN